MSKTPFPKFDEALVQGIEEALDMQRLTEITRRADMEMVEAVLSDTDGDSLGYRLIGHYRLLVAAGLQLSDIGRTVYARPMFESLPATTWKGSMIYTNPCPRCQDFSRSWNCPEHPEKRYMGSGRWTLDKPTGFRPVTDGPPALTMNSLMEAFELPDDTPRRIVLQGDPFPGLVVEMQGDVPDSSNTLAQAFSSSIPEGADWTQRNAVIREYLAMLDHIATEDRYSNFAGREEDPRDSN